MSCHVMLFPLGMCFLAFMSLEYLEKVEVDEDEDEVTRP